jgi:hypothetical protein
MPGWEEATAIQKSSSNLYTATLHDDWCIGSGKLPMRVHILICAVESTEDVLACLAEALADAVS